MARVCGIGTLVLIVLALCGESAIRDQYYLKRLESSDDATSLKAVSYFCEHRLTWAIPRMVQVYKEREYSSGDWLMGLALSLVSVGEPGVPAFTRMLEDDEADVRSLGAQVLGELGPSALPSLPALIAALGDVMSFVRIVAAGAVADIAGVEGESHALAVRALVKALRRESDPDVIPYVVRSISDLCPRSASMLSDFEQGVRSEQDRRSLLQRIEQDCLQR